MCMRGKGNDHWTLLLLVEVVLSWGRRMKKMIRWSFSSLVCLPPFSFSFQQSSILFGGGAKQCSRLEGAQSPFKARTVLLYTEFKSPVRRKRTVVPVRSQRVYLAQAHFESTFLTRTSTNFMGDGSDVE